MNNRTTRIDHLIDAMKYWLRHRGEIVVVKYGGSFMDSPDPAVREGVARDLIQLQVAGVRPVVVHGGGKAITRAMEKAGLKPGFIRGMRVTDEPTVRVVDQVLSHEINPEIVAAIHRLGGRARGFAGSEIFRCRQLSPEFGFVGDVTGADAERLQQTIREGFIPVVSPTAAGAGNQIYNCNADVAAAQAAIALKANRLVFMSDVPGLLRDPNSPESLIARLAVAEVDALKSAGVIDKGMIPKVDSAVAAVRAGVADVSFIDGRVNHALLLYPIGNGSGTKIVS